MISTEYHFKPKTYLELQLAVTILERSNFLNYGFMDTDTEVVRKCSEIHLDIDTNNRALDIFYHAPPNPSSVKISLSGIMSILLASSP